MKTNAAAGEMMIRTEGLRAGYGKKVLLDGVSITIRRGEFWFVLGPNGEGKTTFFRTALGAIAPLGGTVARHPDFRRPGFTAFVPQRSTMKPTMPTTVREFIDLGLAVMRLTGAERRESIRRSLDEVGLPGMTERDYWSLSGGQRQRVLVARALALGPEILFADEPTNGLDGQAEETLLESLAASNAAGLTILFITHDWTLAARFASHVLVVNGGRVRGGTATEMLTEEIARPVIGAARAERLRVGMESNAWEARR